MTGPLISLGGFGHDEGDASAVGREFDAGETAKVEHRLWSQSLGRGGGRLLGGTCGGKKRKTEQGGEKSNSPHLRSSKKKNKRTVTAEGISVNATEWAGIYGSAQIEERFLASLAMTIVGARNEEARSESKMGGANFCLYRPSSYDHNVDCDTNAKFMRAWF